MESLEDLSINQSTSSKNWWATRRIKYNKGLVIAGILAFICYVVAGVNLIMPYDDQFEITLFTIFFQSLAYLIMMAIANVFYNLGYSIDKRFNKNNADCFRLRLFNCGFWFSFALPFLIPTLIVVEYFVYYKK